LFEFFIWRDLDNRLGINQLISFLLPIYIYLEPLVLINLQLWIYQLPFTPFMAIYQLLYVIFMATKYTHYINHETVVTTCNHNVLDWKWISKYPFHKFVASAVNIILYHVFKTGLAITVTTLPAQN
jgi:hypothetical protein